MDDENLGAAEHEISAALIRQRPVPAPKFRGTLGREIAEQDPGYGPRPARLRPAVSLCLLAGLLIMALGALQATGAL